MTFNPVAALNVLECRNIITNDSQYNIDDYVSIAN